MSRCSTIRTACANFGSSASPRSLIFANTSASRSVSDRLSELGSVGIRPILKARYQKGSSTNHMETPSDTKPGTFQSANRRASSSVTKREINFSRPTTVALVEF